MTALETLEISKKKKCVTAAFLSKLENANVIDILLFLKGSDKNTARPRNTHDLEKHEWR